MSAIKMSDFNPEAPKATNPMGVEGSVPHYDNPNPLSLLYDNQILNIDARII
jgi:hypothetical protein